MCILAFGIYGVEAASQRFWGKHASQFTLMNRQHSPQLFDSPGQYCPIINPFSTQRRRNHYFQFDEKT